MKSFNNLLLENASIWKMPNRSSKIYYFETLESTMDTALALARQGCESGTVVVAGCQTKGRGRMTRVWHSEKGGLYFTIIIRPDILLEHSARIGFAASLSMARSLNQLFGIAAMVKWPNDLLVGCRKISGMLSQVEAQSNRISFLNIGIGLNVNNDAFELAPESTSVKSLLNKIVSPKEILFDFLNRLDTLLSDSKAIISVMDEWKKHTITLGRKVKIVTNQGTYHGIARDVDTSGALILELENGMFQTVLYGDCFHQ